MSRILIPLPSRGYDPSEAAISWSQLNGYGHSFAFSTPDGKPAEADPLMVTGEGLDVWSRIPGLQKLKLVGLSLRADARARAAYQAMLADSAYQHPQAWKYTRSADFDALLLPGGHAKQIREYLESPLLQQLVSEFFAARKPVAAICHGVVLAARSKDAATGRSVLYGRKTTALTWAFEKKAAGLARYTRYWEPDYYRTYSEAPGEPEGYWSVQSEVTRALASPGDFCDVAAGSPGHFLKTSGLFRDHPRNNAPAFVVRDGNYVSGRWPGDAHSFADTFGDVLAGR